MANRRMFSKTITQSSSFLMMPTSSRLLYYDLGMSADDDGYCEYFGVMRMTGSDPDDLRVLEARGFVQIFDDKVLVILDWKENNYIQADRYTPSKYLKVHKTRTPKTLPRQSNPRIQDVYKVDTQDRIGKDRIGEDRKEINNTVKKVKKNNTTNKERNNDLDTIEKHFNATFGKKIVSRNDWGNNALFWLNTYSVETILSAITNWKATKTWWGRDNPKLSFLFRQTNKKGGCDYIGELINLEPEPIKTSGSLNNDDISNYYNSVLEGTQNVK